MNAFAENRDARLRAHRLIAHRMDARGASVETIADQLRVSKRSVARYLAAPRPQEPANPRVELANFYLQGACGSFPEYDWLSRSPLMQQQCKAICAHCPVLAACREYGLTTGLDDLGVWGGWTRRERLAEVQRRAHDPDRASQGARPGQGVA